MLKYNVYLKTPIKKVFQKYIYYVIQYIPYIWNYYLVLSCPIYGITYFITIFYFADFGIKVSQLFCPINVALRSYNDNLWQIYNVVSANKLAGTIHKMPHTHMHAHTQALAQHPLCRLLCGIEAELVKLLPQIPDSKSGRDGGMGAGLELTEKPQWQL